jgi:hypothetical protein
MYKRSWKFVSFAICCALQLYLAVGALAADDTEQDKLGLPYSFVVPQPSKNATEAALKGKRRFQRLAVNDKIARELGFDSSSDAADSNTQLGIPFPLIFVHLDIIAKYNSTISPDTYLVFAKRFIFPVKATGKTKSSITVLELTPPGQVAQEWKPVEWGATGLIRLLEKTRDTVAPPSPSFAFWIPALSRYFLGFFNDGKLLVVPLYDELKYGFVAGNPLPETEVFKKLSGEAIALQIPKNRG